jgi:hypothetical protein
MRPANDRTEGSETPHPHKLLMFNLIFTTMKTRKINLDDFVNNEENRQNRLDVIEAILKIASEYTCGNVDYRRENHRIYVWATKHKEFYCIDIVRRFVSFNAYAEYNIPLERIELVLW